MEIVKTNLKFKKKLAKRQKTDMVVVHCTATRVGQDITVEDIHKWHLQRGFAGIGYHFMIGLDGTIYEGRPIDAVGAQVNGHNSTSVGIVYVGGLNENGKPSDTRTEEQKASLLYIIGYIYEMYDTVEKVVGHRDLSPDKNGDGVIEKHEWLKACPCFNAADEYKDLIVKEKKQ